MAVVPRIPDDPKGKTIPIAWRLFHQWFVSRYQGDPKGAFTVYLEGSPEGRVKAPVGSVALRTTQPRSAGVRQGDGQREHRMGSRCAAPGPVACRRLGPVLWPHALAAKAIRAVFG